MLKTNTFYKILAVLGVIIEENCVFLYRFSEHDILKQRSVMLDLRKEM